MFRKLNKLNHILEKFHNSVGNDIPYRNVLDIISNVA